MKRDPRDTSRDRQRRTVEAPNGARLVLPVGTSDMAVFSKQMQFVYEEPYRKLIEAECEMLSLFKKAA